jgi:ubiquinone/menaquinone biosynthesis C-methylase UbiE
MSDTSAIEAMLQPFGPKLELGPLVEEVNRLFHAAEAKDYDRRHPEIRDELPALWHEMLAVAKPYAPAQGWQVLDFGCGTGFASEQILNELGRDRVAHLTCFDASPEMLEKCRTKLQGSVRETRFLSSFDELLASPVKHHLMATNSVLHHLPSPYATLHALERILTADAIYCAGHEPSQRYYRNAECQRLAKAFRKEWKWRKYLSPGQWVAKAADLFDRSPSPAREAAEAAFAKGLFSQKPTTGIIKQLVDFHVPQSQTGHSASLGFDVETLEAGFGPGWQRLWAKSYNHLGEAPLGRLNAKWRGILADLQSRYPLEGADFSTVWRRRVAE